MCAAMVERDPGLNRFNDDHYYNQGGQQNMSYNQDYQKKDQEARRLDELYGRRTHVPEKPELFDYKKQQQHNYEEKKKEYQEFLKKKEAESHMKKPPSPPSVGLDIGKHDMMRKQRQQAMQELYKSQLDEQKNQEIRNAQKRSPTPPVGLNILTQEERRRRDEARKKIYREELLMQQKEQMLSKAQHEIEVPRFNASPQKTSSQPLESSRPPPQDYDRMPPQEYNRRSRDGPMSSMEQQISNDHAYEDRKQQLMREIGADKEARDRQYREMIDRDRDARDIHAQEFHRHDEQLRDKNIMEYLEKKRIEEERQFNHPRKKKLGSDSYGQMDESYDPGRYEEMRHRLQDETHQEYKKELAKGPTNDIKYGLPIGQWRYDQQIKQRQMERNKEYNEFLKAQKKKNPENPKRNLNKRPDSGKDPAKNPSKQIGYMAYPGAREHDRKREERPRDYNGYAPEQPSWYNQEVAPVGLATPNKDEYRQPRERLGSYNHGDYVRDSPTYQEMLESKRRHEAAYRRYDEPGLSHYPQTGQSDPADRYSPRRF